MNIRVTALLLVLCMLSSAWGVPVRTGTPITANLGVANTGSTTVTVPSDATLMVCASSGFVGTTGFYSGGSITIGGQAFTMVTGGDASTSFWMGSIGYRVSPPTGSQTLAWDWSGTGSASDNSELFCSWYTALDTTTPIRSSNCTQQSANPHTTGTLTAQSGDLIVAFVIQFADTDTTFTWTDATEVTEFTMPATYFGDSALAEAAPTGNQTVSASAATSGDGAICAVVVEPAVGGPSPAPARRIILY